MYVCSICTVFRNGLPRNRVCIIRRSRPSSALMKRLTYSSYISSYSFDLSQRYINRRFKLSSLEPDIVLCQPQLYYHNQTSPIHRIHQHRSDNMARLAAFLQIFIACLANFAYALAGPKCPFPITVPGVGGCIGCTRTSYLETSTKSIDCQGCDTLTTTTKPWKFAPQCRYVSRRTRRCESGVLIRMSCRFALGVLRLLQHLPVLRLRSLRV